MLRRIFASIILSLLILTPLPSCSSGPDDAGLTVSYASHQPYVTDAIAEYEEEKGAALEAYRYFYGDSEEEDRKNTERLCASLLSEAPPDIVVFGANDIPELSKFIRSGVFCDLNELMADDGFKLDDYNREVMESGIWEGKRYLIPLGYYIPAIITTGENLSGSAVDTGEERWSWTDIIKAGRERHIFDSVDFLNLAGGLKDFISYEASDASFDSDAFTELLKLYGDLQDSIYPEGRNQGLSIASKSELLKDDSIVLATGSLNNPRNMWRPYSAFEEEIEPRILPYPVSDGEPEVFASPGEFVAVSSKCADKKAAFEFVKLLLSEKHQAGDNFYYLPVNERAYEKSREAFVKNTSAGETGLEYRGGGVTSDETAAKTASALDRVKTALNYCFINDREAVQILREELELFLSGEKAAEDTARTLQERMSAYLMDTDIEKYKREESGEKAKDRSVLTISTMNSDRFMLAAINSYNTASGDALIEPVLYTDYIEMINKTTAQLSAGSGPDLLLEPNSSFPSIHKAAENGALVDLGPKMDGNGFNWDEYYGNVFDCGIFGGRRYYVPLDFILPPLISTKKTMENNGLVYSEGEWTWEYLAGVSKSRQAKGAKKSKYLFAINMLSFQEMVGSSNLPFVDYQNKKTRFNTPEFIRLLELYEELSADTSPTDENRNYPDISSALGDFAAIVRAMEICDPEVLSEYYSELGDEMVLLPFPGLDSEQPVGVLVLRSIGISSTCEHEDEAFDFIRLLLSEEMQSKINYSIPVNRKVHEEMKEKVSNKNPSLEKYLDFIDGLIARVGVHEGLDLEINKILGDSLKEYERGSKSAEEVAKELDQKVTLLLNE